MENKSIIGIIVAIVAIALVALFIGKGGKKEEAAPEPVPVVQGQPVSLIAPADGTYNLIMGEVMWKGEKIGGSHIGNVSAKSGTFTVVGEKVVSGQVVMDMKTIVDGDGEVPNEKLVTHLKSADFFDIAKYPTVTLTVIDWTDPSMAKSELTVKGKKIPVVTSVTVSKVDRAGKEVVDVSVAPITLITDEVGIGQSDALKAMLKKEFTVEFIGSFEVKK